MTPRFAILLALVLAGSLSCTQGPSRFAALVAPPAVHIELTLTASPASGSSAEPVTITATIENLGRSVDLPYRCGIPIIRIFDVQGGELFQHDPTMAVACVQAPTFHSGERRVVPLTFDGGYYASDGTPVEAPPGTYRAIAEYQFFGDSGLQAVTREVVFTWQERGSEEAS